jgi:hypothetical protein
MYQYNQTINITSLNFYCLGMVGIQIWYRNKQYIVITDIVITRYHCIYMYIYVWVILDLSIFYFREKGSGKAKLRH